MSHGHPETARRRVDRLIAALRTLVEQDPEQELLGVALQALDVVFDDVSDVAPDDPMVVRLGAIISPEAIADGEPLRAADALVVAEQLSAILGPQPARVSTARFRLDSPR